MEPCLALVGALCALKGMVSDYSSRTSSHQLPLRARRGQPQPHPQPDREALTSQDWAAQSLAFFHVFLWNMLAPQMAYSVIITQALVLLNLACFAYNYKLLSLPLGHPSVLTHLWVCLLASIFVFDRLSSP